MQHIFFTGNLVRNPESGATATGLSYCTFTVAVDRKYKSNGEKVTDYFRVKTWRQLADLCAKHLVKGRKVGVVGELQASIYEAKDGTWKLSLDVNADEVEFLSPKNESPVEGDTPTERPQKPVRYEDGFTDISSDDIPF